MLVNTAPSRNASSKIENAPASQGAVSSAQQPSGPSAPDLPFSSCYVQARAQALFAPAGQTVPRPVRPSLKASSSAQAHCASPMLHPKLEGRPAEREMRPVKQDQVVDFANDPDQRRNMLRSCPQENEVSTNKGDWVADREVNGKTLKVSVGNGEAICGGAAITNALVLSSKDPAQARTNAEAIRKVAGSLDPKVTLSDAENEALKRFASGSMSPRDVQQLQQVLDRMVHCTNEPNATISGASGEQMIATLALLAKQGAFAGSQVQMHLVGKHWTCTCDNTHVNTFARQDPKSGLHTATVQDGTPPEVNRHRENWTADITLNGRYNPPNIELNMDIPGREGRARSVSFDVGDYQPGDARSLAKTPLQLKIESAKDVEIDWIGRRNG